MFWIKHAIDNLVITLEKEPLNNTAINTCSSKNIFLLLFLLILMQIIIIIVGKCCITTTLAFLKRYALIKPMINVNK